MIRSQSEHVPMFSAMHSFFLLAAEAMSPPAAGPGTTMPARPMPPGCGGPDTFKAFIVPMIIVFVVMYLFVIAPQRKRDKERRQMLESIRKGDRVVTIGGIHGNVWQVKDDEIVLKVEGDVKLTFSRAAVARVIREGGAPSDGKE